MPLPIYLLSGLASDARLFGPQRSLPLDLRMAPWLAARCGEPAIEYARRMAESIDTSRPFILGGVSFGGLMAMQMTRFVRPQAVILISSCRGPRGLPGWYSAPAQIVTACVSPSFLKTMRLRWWGMRYAFGPSNSGAHRLLMEMFDDCDPELLFWSMRAVTALPEVPDPGIPVHHIHGRLDRVIPVRLSRPDVIVEDAGHMLNVTHAEAANRFIVKCTRRYDS